MPDPVPFHDYTIDSLLVYASERRLVLRAFDAHASSAPLSVAEFSGVAGYHIGSDVLGTILFDIEPVDDIALYDRHAAAVQRDYGATGSHLPRG